MEPVKIGIEAPDFTLVAHTGEKITLSQFRGKKNVVLYFYPKDGSPGCTREACAFRDSHEIFKDLGAEVLGLNAGSLESHRKFVEKENLTFLLLVDEGNQVRKLYSVPATLGIIPGRVTYIIDKKGTVRHIFSSQSEPEKHIQEAIRILKTLD